MTVNTEVLLHLTSLGNTFRRCEGGFRVYLDYLQGDDGQFVKDEVISSVHPRLPAALELLIARSPKHQEIAKSLDVLRMLELWECDLFFHSKNGLDIAGSVVYNVELLDTRVELILDGYRYEEVKVPFDNEPYLIPFYVCTEASISHAWLDNNHPQWRERFLMAIDLGHDANAAVRAMLNMFKPVVPLEIPNDISI